MSTSLEDRYKAWCEKPHATREHMDTLRRLAASCEFGPIIEFGTQYGASAVAFLSGAQPGVKVIGYDIKVTQQAWELAMDQRTWQVYQANTLEIPPVKCEMLFVDSLHTYAQVRGELERHADGVSRLLVFHDTTTFGCVGADGGTGSQSHQHQRGQPIPPEHYGVRMAIDELMVRDPSWRLVEAHHHGHGLLVLERVQ